MIYNKIYPFRFWCQKVLPLVYDDSLSYYELLCKVVEYLNNVITDVNSVISGVEDLEEQFETLKKYVDTYFDNLDVQEEINNKLDEMAQDGSLSDIINNCASYVSAEIGWNVIKVGDSYIQSLLTDETATVESFIKSAVGNPDINMVAYYTTPAVSKILAIPIKEASCAGNVESYLGDVTNARVQNHSTYRRQCKFSDDEIGPSGSSRRYLVHSIVIGKHADFPQNIKYPISQKSSEALAIADSYYQAKLNGRKFAYGRNFITYANETMVNDGYGYGMMECDTLISLVMMGIPYNLSPYANTTPSLAYNFADLVENPNGYSWCLPWKYNATVGRKVTYTGAQNWYFWDDGAVFPKLQDVVNGDIAIFVRRGVSKYFDGITHIGIIRMVDGVPWLYHFTGANGLDSPMQYEPLSNVIERGNYDVEKNLYFARPNYA